jgi:hypothetical protein
MIYRLIIFKDYKGTAGQKECYTLVTSQFDRDVKGKKKLPVGSDRSQWFAS